MFLRHTLTKSYDGTDWLLIVNHWGKRDNGVMCTAKEIKFGLKLVRMETDVVTHTCKILLWKKNPEH